jgi:hypothetical protein
VGTFLGVKKEIRAGVRIFKQHTLLDAIELTRMKDKTVNKLRRNQPPENPQQSNFSKPWETCTTLTMPTNSRVTPSGPTKKFSWKEMQK